MEGKVALKFSVIGCSSQLSSLLGRKRVLLLVLSFSRKTRKIVGLLVGNLETMQISACVCVCVCFHFRNRHRHHFSGASDPWPELMHFRVLSLRHAFWWCQGQVCLDANQSSWQLIATDLRATASWKLLLLLLSLNIFAVGESSSGDLYGQRKLLRVTSLYRQTF